MSSMSTNGERHIPAWTFGDRVRKAREQAGLTQAEMAEKLNVSRKTLANYEADHTQPQRPLDFAEALAAAANVPTYWVLFGEDDAMGFARELDGPAQLVCL
jgi:transcriptional regulator with XRE-family HTH domain